MTDLPRCRREARELSISKYFTGKPCKRGHIAARYTVDTKCVECRRRRNLTDAHGRSVYRRRKTRNGETRDTATNRNQTWPVDDINLVLARDERGAYLHSETELARRLGRTIYAVKNARVYFRNEGKHE